MTTHDGEASTSNFLRQTIEADFRSGRLEGKRWAPPPASAEVLAIAPNRLGEVTHALPARAQRLLAHWTRQSICLNFGLAHDYGGACHLRFDDTNPEKEEQAYVDAILDAVQWLGV